MGVTPPPPHPPPKYKVAKNFNHKMIQVLLKLAFFNLKILFLRNISFSFCVQAFNIWITVVEVMVYPFVLEPVLRQASVCPPTGMFDARLFTFEQIIILTTMKLKSKI